MMGKKIRFSDRLEKRKVLFFSTITWGETKLAGGREKEGREQRQKYPVSKYRIPSLNFFVSCK